MIKKSLHVNLHEELRPHFLYIAKPVDNYLSTFIIYCIEITIFPIVYVLGLYSNN